MAGSPSAVLHLLPRICPSDGAAAAPAASQPYQRGNHRAPVAHRLGPGRTCVQEAHRIGRVRRRDAERVRPRAAGNEPADDARPRRLRRHPPVACRHACDRHVAVAAPSTARRAALPDARGRRVRRARVAPPQDLARGVGPPVQVARDGRRARVHSPVQVVRERVGGASAAVGRREAGRLFAQEHLAQGVHLARTGERCRATEAPGRPGVLMSPPPPFFFFWLADSLVFVVSLFVIVVRRHWLGSRTERDIVGSFRSVA